MVLKESFYRSWRTAQITRIRSGTPNLRLNPNCLRVFVSLWFKAILVHHGAWTRAGALWEVARLGVTLGAPYSNRRDFATLRGGLTYDEETRVVTIPLLFH